MNGARAQTTLDFALAVSIFLVVLLFSFAFIPGILQPFTAGTQEETIGVNRIADELTRGNLTEPGKPYVLNGTCVGAFFQTGATTACGYSGSTIGERLDIEQRHYVNVTVHLVDSSGTAIACWNATTKSVVKETGNCNTNAYVLQGGEDIPRGSVESVSARRTAYLGDSDVSIRVVMW